MSRVRFDNGIIVTLNDDYTVHWGGTVVTEGKTILYAGDAAGAPEALAEEERIDASGCVVMPGLVDLHYHTAIGRGYGDWLPLWEFLDVAWYPFLENLTPETAYQAALATYAESIMAGVTTVNDMFREVPSLAKAAEKIGIRAVLSNDVMSDDVGQDTLETNLSSYQQVHGAGDGRIEVYVGFEWLPKGSKELMRETRELADELKTGIHIHLNESLSEVNDALERYGKRPTELAYETGILGPDCVAAHCVHLNDREIALMRDSGTSLSHNPVSNAKLGNGVARVPDWIREGINVGIGHDAAECNNSRNLWEVAKMASLIHRATRGDASLMPAKQILTMATVNGNRALHHNGGQLIASKLADLIVINTHTLSMSPLEWGNDEQLFSHLVYSNNGSSVRDVVIDGNIVMRDRVLTNVDESTVIDDANAAFSTVLRQVNGNAHA